MNEPAINHASPQLEASPAAAWKLRPLAIVAALVLNVVILTVGRLINGEFPVATVGSDDQTIGYVSVIVVTVIVGLIAWGLLALLQRRTSRAATIWTVIAIALFLLSLLGPLGSAVNASSRIVLTCLHLGTAVTFIPLMRRKA